MASPGGSNSSTVRTSSGLKSKTNNRNKKREIYIISPSSSGGYDNSSGISSEPVGSEETSELQALMEQRRKRRKESNRESARRSRMRKQLHLDGMADQVASLRAENYKMLVMLERATIGILTVEAENSVLRTQTMELESRLRSLNEIIKCISATDTNIDAVGDTGLVSPWNMGMGMMMPVVQSVDLYQCFQA